MMKPVLVILNAFLALTAIGGGALLMAAPDGSLLDMPVEMLSKTPFKNFFIPGRCLIK
jgi:hypothetical protein